MSGGNQWKLKEKSNAPALSVKTKGEPSSASHALQKSTQENVSSHQIKNPIGTRIPGAVSLKAGTSEKAAVSIDGNRVRQSILKDSRRPAGGLSSNGNSLDDVEGNKNPFAVDNKEPEPESPLIPGRTKGLAGFWANQNDDVKVVKKKRLTSVEESMAPHVVENTPLRLDGVVRSDDPGEWKKPLQLEAGSTKIIAANIMQKPDEGHKRSSMTGSVGQKDDSDGQRVKVKDLSQQIVRPKSDLWKEKAKPEIETITMPTAIVLAENQPAELNPDVIRNCENTEDVVLETGRTRNLLQHWKNTEVDFMATKVSTSRYQGSKPAWILEIEAAKGIVSEEDKGEEECQNICQTEEIGITSTDMDKTLPTEIVKETKQEKKKPVVLDKQKAQEYHARKELITDKPITDKPITDKSSPEIALEYHARKELMTEKPSSEIAPSLTINEKSSEIAPSLTMNEKSSDIGFAKVKQTNNFNEKVADRSDTTAGIRISPENVIHQEIKSTEVILDNDSKSIEQVHKSEDLLRDQLPETSWHQTETAKELPQKEEVQAEMSEVINVNTPDENTAVVPDNDKHELLLPDLQDTSELQKFVGKELNLDDLLNFNPTKEWQETGNDETPCLTPCSVVTSTPVLLPENEDVIGKPASQVNIPSPSASGEIPFVRPTICVDDTVALGDSVDVGIKPMTDFESVRNDNIENRKFAEAAIRPRSEDIGPYESAKDVVSDAERPVSCCEVQNGQKGDKKKKDKEASNQRSCLIM